MADLIEFPGAKRATRISVSGRRGGYAVRVDGGRAFHVTIHGGEAFCECGAPYCIHVTSLRDCGFVDTQLGASGMEEARAA